MTYSPANTSNASTRKMSTELAKFFLSVVSTRMVCSPSVSASSGEIGSVIHHGLGQAVAAVDVDRIDELAVDVDIDKA